MGFMDKVRDFSNRATESVKRFQNTTFKEAVISICARVAAADGTIDASEKSSVARAIQAFDALKVFDARELGRLFNEYCDDAVDEYAIINLNSRISKLASNREAALTAVQIGIAVANSDGNFAPAEKKVVAEILKLLKLSESDLSI